MKPKPLKNNISVEMSVEPKQKTFARPISESAQLDKEVNDFVSTMSLDLSQIERDAKRRVLQNKTISSVDGRIVITVSYLQLVEAAQVMSL